ncbi:MAG: hypothetical protein ACK2UY_03435 [Anaerolineae bacterium]|jgi:hypothetical protein
MITQTTTTFGGHDCIQVQNQALSLWVTTTVGPRILGLSLPGGENLFAELPGVTFPCPGAGEYQVRGGHRLWYAPESPPRTYLPDDAPVGIEPAERGLVVTQPIEPATGVQKSMAVTLPGEDARVVVDHVVSNRSSGAIELAPWAITQLKAGGTAILPQPAGPADEYGVLANRHVVLWPYTAVDSPHVTWGHGHVLVEATLAEGAWKIGFPNAAGWLAYVRGDTLFVKHAAYDPTATYPDRGSSSECYCDHRFLELETLGPMIVLQPGQSITHRETWAVYPGVSFRPDEAGIRALVAQFGLGQPG